MRVSHIVACVFVGILMVACSTTKNIPQGSYLLDKVEVKHDTHNATSDLELFLRQEPNSSLPLFGKVRLKIYNMAGSDTTKRKNRVLRKIGQEPVIYSVKKTRQSIEQLAKEAQNQGYLFATVDTITKVKGNKIGVTYMLKGDKPYRIRKYEYTIADSAMSNIMGRVPLEPAFKVGDMFDQAILEKERERISLIMRNAGYYGFAKELAYFKADTTVDTRQVDLFLNIYPTESGEAYHRTKFKHVTVVSGINAQESTNLIQGIEPTNRRRGNKYMRYADTTEYHGIDIIRGRNKFLRNSSILKNLYVKEERYYSDMALSRTYEAFNKMGAIKQVNISTTPSKEDSVHYLDATILLTPANPHWFRASLDGTNSAGDIGIAPSLSYQHQNIFNGSEQLGINLKGAYEFIAGKNSGDLMNQNFYEYGVETSLTFPMFVMPWLKKKWRDLPSATTRYTIGYNTQHRQEYTRDFFTLTANYNWRTSNNRFAHGVDLFDINFIRMPSVSHRFDSLYLQNPKNPLLRESYKDQLIARTSYSFTMTNKYRFNPMKPTYTFRSSIEVAGYMPRLISNINGTDRDSDGQRRMLGVAYAEYVKGSFDFAKTYYFSKIHSVAYHASMGIAHPYGNSKVLPFERRFFVGGANSIRGWSTRRLGPGSYVGTDDNSDFVNQTGDFKLEFSIENRHKVTSMLEFGEFIDAGNVWTIKNYENQPGGQLKASKFYKEIALAYGAGIRLDLSFLLLRLDCGVRAYDPGKESGKWVIFKPRTSRMALHFGIGYPF